MVQNESGTADGKNRVESVIGQNYLEFFGGSHGDKNDTKKDLLKTSLALYLPSQTSPNCPELSFF